MKKIKVCINIDADINRKFKRKYPMMLSKYVEKCMKDGLNDDKKVFESVKNDSIFETIFNRGLYR